MMPTWLGEPMYPYGFPLRKEDIRIDSENIMEIFLRRCNEKHTEQDEEILKEYVLYFMNAPVFDLSELEGQDLKSMSLDELINACLEVGIDPF